MIYPANMICEALNPEYTLMGRNLFLKKLALSTVIDCKTLYDNSQSVCLSASGVTDKLTTVDFTIFREMSKDSGLDIKWAPGPRQPADALTRHKEEPAPRLRGAVRSCTPQLAEAGEQLRQLKEERELKAAKNKEKGEKSSSSSRESASSGSPARTEW